MLRWVFLVSALAWVGRAHASTATLDYVAASECPDAARFVAEVSARLGRVPFGGEGGDVVRVRVGPDGDAWFATVELADGSDRVLRGVACADVVALAATAVAEYFMFRGAPAQARQEASPRTAPPVPPSAPPALSPASPRRGTNPHGIQVRFRLRSDGIPPLADLYRAATDDERICTLPCVAVLTRGAVVGLRLDHGPFRPLDDLGELVAPTDVLVAHRSRRAVRRFGWTLLGIGLVLVGVSFLPLVVSEDANTVSFATLVSTGVVALGLGAGLSFVRDRLVVERLPD